MLKLNIDQNTYANDAFAAALLANTAKIAAENTVDPVSLDPNYALLETAARTSVACALVGPAGTGKSVAVALLANKLGVPLIIFQATTETRAASLLGRWVPSQSGGHSYEFEKGLLLRAYERGYWFDCEEYLQFAPEQQSLLMKIIDGSPSFELEATHEIIQRHENFRFIGTGNPDYAGNKDKQKNAAFLDRVRPTIYIPALSVQAIVAQGLSKYPKYRPTTFFKTACRLNEALASIAQTNLRKELAFSTRNINGLCETIEAYGGQEILEDDFSRLVRATFGSAIAQVGGGCEKLKAIFDDNVVKSHVSALYAEYRKTLPQEQQKQQAQQQAQAQSQAAPGVHDSALGAYQAFAKRGRGVK